MAEEEPPHAEKLADIVDEIHSMTPVRDPFTALKNTTAVLSATISNDAGDDLDLYPHTADASNDEGLGFDNFEGVLPAKVVKGTLKHKNLMGKLQGYCAENRLEGEIVVVNSNFGAVWQPHYENRVKREGKQQVIAPAGHRHRQPEGHGGSFNSSLEPICHIDPDSVVGRRLQARDEDERIYKMKFFPSSGSTQVSGVVLPDYADGHRAFEAWVALLNKSLLLGGPAKIADRSIAVEMANFKFQLQRTTERQVIDFDAFCAIITDPLEPIQPPAPVDTNTIKYPVEGAKASFKMMWTDGRRTKNPRVNLFLNSGRINLLGFPSKEFAEEVFQYLQDVFQAHWSDVVVLQPLPDNAPPICFQEITATLDMLLAKMVPDPPKNSNGEDWSALFC